MEKPDHVYLKHIRDAIEAVGSHVDGVAKDQFDKSRLIQSAVIRELEIIGEATKKISDALKQEHTNIEWREIAGMRDKLIHDYFGVDLDLVWDVVKNDIMKLKREIAKLLGDYSGS